MGIYPARTSPQTAAPPACPEAVVQSLIDKHGQGLWHLWEQEQARLAQHLQHLADAEQETSSQIAALNTLPGRMEWLQILWSSPYTRWRAKQWLDENGDHWGITCTDAGPRMTQGEERP
ncbi:MAG: hypothetical protein OHK0012_26000 [Synechococcales cyanobacterium]